MLKTLQSIFTNKADKDVKFMKPFFSILVPIYNVDPYLTKCLDSLIHQTFTDIQIICINDGSTDRCQEILEEYSKKDSRIQIINQRNNGYGAALNRGLTYVKADYISIIEPDDYLKLDAYEKFFCDILQNPNIDIIKYAYWQFRDIDGVKKIEPSASSKLSLPEIPFQITQYPQLLLYHPSIWSCVYKTTFIQKHNLCFVEAPGAGWTDNPFFIATMCLAKSILWKNQKVYFYRQGHKTASSNLKDCKIPILRLIDIFNIIDQHKVIDFGVLLCIYKRVFSYINIVRDNVNYSENEIEPLIYKLLLKMDATVVNTEFFGVQEKELYHNNVIKNEANV